MASKQDIEIIKFIDLTGETSIRSFYYALSISDTKS